MLRLEALRGGSFLAFSGFWWLMSILRVPWLTGASAQSLLPFSHVCVYVCVFCFLFLKGYFGVRAHPNPVGLPRF